MTVSVSALPAFGSIRADRPAGDTLRAYQGELDSAIERGAEQVASYVGVGAGPDHWLLDVRDVLEASVVPQLVRAGRSPKGVVGIASFRGKILTLVDMQELLFGMPFRPAEQGWATALHPRHGCAVALVWPTMAGLLDTQKLLPCAFPQGPNSYWVKSCWQDEAGVTWKELDLLKWLTSNKWCELPDNDENNP